MKGYGEGGLQSAEEEFQYKRSILATVAFMTDPDTQDIRESTYEKLIKQLVWLDKEDDVSIQKLQKEIIKEYYKSLSHDALWKILNSMRAKNTVIIRNNVMSLSVSEKERVSNIFKEAKWKLSRVVNKLFDTNESSPALYERPFLFTISHVFATLGEKSVRLIKGEMIDETSVRACISNSISLANSKYRKVSQNLLRNRITFFFRDTQDIDFSSIKQNLAQNYFIAKAIGIDPSGSILTKAVFNKSVFFLDTNILLCSMDPLLRDHEIIKSVVMYIKKLDSTLRIAKASLSEIARLGTHYKNITSKIKDQDSLDRLLREFRHSDIISLYKKKKEKDPSVTFDKVLEPFLKPEAIVRAFFQTKIEDTEWFENNRASDIVRRFSEKIELLYLDLYKVPKHKKAALHDALVLLWIEEEYSKRYPGRKIWFFTNDFSLTEEGVRGFYNQRIITLDTFLQWMFPQPNSHVSDFQDVYSELIQKRLLPQEISFSTLDFEVFEELGLSIDEMDSEKVVDLYRYIRDNIQRINPSDPRSRESFHRAMRNYMTDPLSKHGRDYSKSLRLNQEYKEYIRLSNKARKAKVKCLIILFVVVAIEFGVLLLSNKYGVGDNLYRRVVHSWPLLAFGIVTVSAFLSLFLFNRGWKESIRYLRWSSKKYLKDHPGIAESIEKEV